MSKVRTKICDKNYKTAEIKLTKILSKIESLKLPNSYIAQLEVPGKCKDHKERGVVSCSEKMRSKLSVTFRIAVIILIVFGIWGIYSKISSETCLLSVPSSAKDLFRQPELDCSMCEHVTEAVRVSNITAREFEELYAYGTTPVVVTDAMDGWKAVEEFSFAFFANFYKTNKLGQQINECFFFPYKTGFDSLQEVFNMDEKRANLSGRPWYVGWSTCYDEETRRLREYYDRPYFIPTTAESDMVNWIFMGGPGQGAHMHVDSVRHMSWQAQIRGSKLWELAPPPECFYRCQSIQVVVRPKECIVVDTNRWYHRTNVLPGDISITIGAEYD